MGTGQGRRQGRFALKGRTLARHSSASWNPALLCSPARHSRMLLAGIQCLCFLFFFKSKGFHSSCGRAAYFLCSCKESRQRNTPQRLAPDAHRARRVRVIGRVPLIAHPVQQRNRRDPSRRPCGPYRPLPPQGHGSPRRARARASCAQKQKAKGRSKAAFALAVALDSGPRQPRRGQAGIARRVARRDAREFANGQDAHRANPGLTLRTAEGSAAPGVHFFWLLFFVQTKKSDPRAGRARKNEGTRLQVNQEQSQNWIPASAGMTSRSENWIPALM